MSLWGVKSGYTFGVLNEREFTTLTFPLSTVEPVTLEKISGDLPLGLRIEGVTLIGTPFEVSRTTEYKFVIRARTTSAFEDRTLSITIAGEDDPLWITQEGTLPIGPNNIFFILDSTPVEFQLQAIDNDIPAGDKLEYFISSGDGDLPPGITLTDDGRLIGIVDPILSLDKDASGNYETSLYDSSFYDFSVRSFNGFSSFYYDTEIYDYSIPTRVPKKLNRYYQFAVSVYDGETITKRVFKIYVVGDDFLRADNTIMQLGNGLFTADNSNIRTPIWITPSDLGYRRANNYVSILFECIDNNTLAGELSFVLVSTNPDGSPSVLPPGMELESADGELAGRVPYQPAITKEYKFTIRAQRVTPGESAAIKDKTFSIKLLGEIESAIVWTSDYLLGTIPANNTSVLNVEAVTSITDARVYYSLISGKLPPGLSLSLRGDIVGKVNQFKLGDVPGLTTLDKSVTTFDGGTTSFDREYEFTVQAKDQLGYSATEKTFKIIVDDPDDKLYSNIYLKPFLKESQRFSFLNFINDGGIFKLDNIFRPNDSNFGIQKDLQVLLYPGIESKKLEEFVAAAAKHHTRKKFKFGELKTAQAKIAGSNEVLYEVVYMEIVDPAQNTKISSVSSFDVYRNKPLTADQIQYAPIDSNVKTLEGDPYVTVQSRKGPTTVAVSAGTVPVTLQNGNVVYASASNVPITFGDAAPFRFRPEGDTLKADSNLVKISDIKKSPRYISNINNMRAQIKTVGTTTRDFLPLWMITSQPGAIQEIGFVPCVVLAYCKPSKSEEIFFNIKNSGFDFKTINLDIDRYVIDSTEGISQPQYIVFPKTNVNV
jgi:hypothetical protein